MKLFVILYLVCFYFLICILDEFNGKLPENQIEAYLTRRLDIELPPILREENPFGIQDCSFRHGLVWFKLNNKWTIGDVIPHNEYDISPIELRSQLNSKTRLIRTVFSPFEYHVSNASELNGFFEHFNRLSRAMMSNSSSRLLLAELIIVDLDWKDCPQLERLQLAYDAAHKPPTPPPTLISLSSNERKISQKNNFNASILENDTKEDVPGDGIQASGRGRTRRLLSTLQSDEQQNPRQQATTLTRRSQRVAAQQALQQKTETDQILEPTGTKRKRPDRSVREGQKTDNTIQSDQEDTDEFDVEEQQLNEEEEPPTADSPSQLNLDNDGPISKRKKVISQPQKDESREELLKRLGMAPDANIDARRLRAATRAARKQQTGGIVDVEDDS